MKTLRELWDDQWDHDSHDHFDHIDREELEIFVDEELRKTINTLVRREEQLREMIDGINTCYEILHVCLENNMSPTTSYRNEASNYRDRSRLILAELEKK